MLFSVKREDLLNVFVSPLESYPAKFLGMSTNNIYKNLSYTSDAAQNGDAPQKTAS